MKQKLLTATVAIFLSASMTLADDCLDLVFVNLQSAVLPCIAAAEQGDGNAQTILGMLYDGTLHSNEERIEQNYGEAVRWYLLAAEQGGVFAQAQLGSIFVNGLGVAQDYAEAVRWYRAAAEQGNADAQFALGGMYHGGLGAAQDYAEALRWFRLAALGGNGKAQNNLGRMYDYGEGVIQNYVRAHMWYNISAANGTGEIAINNRNRVAALMTPQQIADAQTRAQQCLDSNYADC
jgi:TPR repeat protein